MLITRAEVYGHRLMDVRIEDGTVTALGALVPNLDEPTLEANGGALIPGLHDHHIHFLAFAASLDSARCGPPDVLNEQGLIATLQNHPPNSTGWIRGYGYHESVAGDIDRHWLDRHGPDVPIRIQHRSGRLWVINSCGLALLPPNLPADGRLYDRDTELREWLSAAPPSTTAIAAASQQLAAYGITRLTDMTPTNDDAIASMFQSLHKGGDLKQCVQLAGTASLTSGGPTKIHLHESDLPPFEALCAVITHSHAQQRCIAVHCVTEVELVFTLAAIRAAGPRPGDRIEHASVTPPALLEQIRDLGLQVVTQPNFIAERGDAYAADVAPADLPWLYRARGFLDRDVPLAAGTDAPFGHPDPWRAMHAAVHRKTQSGLILGSEEALTPEQALALFTDVPIEVGSSADLCLLDVSWQDARNSLSSDRVRATVHAGSLTFDCVDQSPGQSALGR